MNSRQAQPGPRLPAPRLRVWATALGRGLPLAVLIGVAVAIAAFGARTLDHHIDRTLHVATDVIGYPIFQAFNPYVYITQYELAVVVFPATTVVICLLGLWVFARLHVPLPAFADRSRRSSVDTPATARGETGTTPVDAMAVLASWARIALVGGVLGFGATIARNTPASNVWRTVLVVAAVYTLVVVLMSAALASSNRKQDGWDALRRHQGRFNGFGACLTLSALIAASQATQVTVLSDHTVHHYAWLPTSLGVVLLVAAVLVAAVALRRAGREAAAVVRVEQRLVFLVAVPVFLFVALAFVFGQLGDFDAFEVGQSQTTLRLVQSGLFPWSGWISTHGILEDAFQPLLTSTSIQDSYWGAASGYTLWVVPLCLLSFYFLAYRVVGKGWLLLVPVLGVLLLHADLGNAVIFWRFVTWPLVLVLLWFVLESRGRWLAIALGAALAIEAVITPETAYCIAAVGFAVLARDLYATGGRRANLRLPAFTTTLWTAVGGVTVAAVLLVILLSQHALDDFVKYYTAFAPDHILTGGLPHQPLTGQYLMEVVVPVVAMLAGFFLVVTKLWLRVRLTTLDWMLIAAAILEFLYYPKFLDRADLHVNETFATCVPLLIILIGEIADVGGPLLVRLFARVRGLSSGLGVAALFAVLVWLFPFAISPAVKAAPAGYRTTVSSEPRIAALGYATPTALDINLLNDVSTFLHAYLPAGGHVFDFTDEPAFLYYLMDFRPGTAYYQVSIAMRQVIQRDLIAQLQADHPLFVLYNQTQLGIPGWDYIPTMVRHYDISQYILSHYRPFADVHGQTIYVLDTANVPDPRSLHLPLSTPLITTDLPFVGFGCDWGDAPNFLSVKPPPPPTGASPISVGITRTGPASLRLTLPSGHRWDDYSWIELDAAARFTSSLVIIDDRPSPPGEHRTISFKTMPTGPTAYRFPIGACSQWPAYGSEPLELTMTVAEDIGAIHLIP
ncbi:MAG: hypothetical protein ABI473_09680 [Candidatus Dormibacter sp.]